MNWTASRIFDRELPGNGKIMIHSTIWCCVRLNKYVSKWKYLNCKCSSFSYLADGLRCSSTSSKKSDPDFVNIFFCLHCDRNYVEEWNDSNTWYFIWNCGGDGTQETESRITMHCLTGLEWTRTCRVVETNEIRHGWWQHEYDDDKGS